MPPRRYQPRRGPRPQRRRQAGAAVAEAPQAAVRPTGPVELPSSVAVKDLADALGVSTADVIKELIRNGIFATINQSIDFDTASLVAGELGIETVERGAAERAAAEAAGPAEIVAPGSEEEGAGKPVLFSEDNPADLVTRAPIVTIMGHVDHGKTSLLDAIRSTTVAEGERGGITQHIGASEIEHNGKRIVFLDTPGHEAFTAMRARGAQVTDIAIIVVAADDGVMPQTKEAIDHVRAARVPMIVAINKIDKPDANPDRVKQELADNNVLIEEYGGDVISVAVSAKQKLGLDDLMEMILLVADLQDLKANPQRPAVGTIIESKVEKGRGNVATVLVQTGTLRVGDIVAVGRTHGRVRALQNAAGKRVKLAEPATAVEIIGLADLPEAGDILRVVADEKAARDMAEANARAAGGGDGKAAFSLEDISAQIQASEVKELRVVLKTDVQGSLGAIRHALEGLNMSEARINILREGAGDINESDVLLASASDAVVIGFNTRPDAGAQRAIDASGVDVRLYDVIYKLTDDVGAALQGMLAPKLVEQVEGHAEVRMVIKAGRAGNIAGSYVTDGRIVRGGDVRLFRGGAQVGEGRITSLKRFKDDVREVATGFECGIGLSLDDIAEGDVIECFQMVSEPA
ncbi:MAG TPA: translation initiation factor IF-2 [Candidatus Limnocylindria bacterium]|jgi:translation initiation factor IF-2|nr:translation initiation factor IF-2 [Candidatus Limnocylindria bacterium]